MLVECWGLSTPSMGTNFYFRKPLVNYCEHRGRSDPPEELHIGKSSAGWCFSLHVYPEQGIHALDDWEAIWPNGTIFDEYGDELTKCEMLAVITGRSSSEAWDSQWASNSGYFSEEVFHCSNNSERGPNGLLRHRIDGSHCIGHGPGTYDYITGDFS
jgi:hypothetical protein